VRYNLGLRNGTGTGTSCETASPEEHVKSAATDSFAWPENRFRRIPWPTLTVSCVNP